MNILLTNDDGWNAPGLAALQRVAGRWGRVVTVAPSQQQSGISHQLTFHRPVKLVEQSVDQYALDGTPADCVRIGLTQLGVPFDWVLSGVNDGGNLGADVYVSGTVAAAREGQLHGVRSMALSQYRIRYSDSFDWSQVDPVLEAVLKIYLQPLLESNHNQANSFLNVNFPDSEGRSELPKMVECGLDPNPLPAGYESTPEGFVYSSRYRDRSQLEGCDVAVCFAGDISVSVL
ncbi:MAG: 5'/3'-nucleotidase SurE [Mariniblastus sp.]|nr:5'/3'-nucleotidase SurE [Mariniblastus sp.]